MDLTFTIYSFALLVGFIVALTLAVVNWTRGNAPGTVPLTLLIVSGALWLLGSAFEVSAVDVSTRIICNKICYIGITSGGVFWLVFTWEYSGLKWGRKPAYLVLLSIAPLFTMIMILTNELHNWEWTKVYLVNGPLGLTSIWEAGPLYWVNPATQYTLYLAGMVVLYRFGLKRKGVYRKQVNLILTGTLIALIGSLLFTFKVDIAGGMDLTPFFLVIAAVFYSVAMLHYRFPDIVPVAQQAILKNIPDGFLVLDNQGNVVDINPKAEKLIGQEKFSVQGKALDEIWPELYRLVAGFPVVLHIELTAGPKDTPVCLDIGIVTLIHHRESVGRLIVLRDITELKKVQMDLEKLYEKEHRLSISLEKEITRRSEHTRALVHELGTPLTAIMASTDSLKDMVKDSTQMRLVKNVLRSSSNLEKRINELLDLARGELGILRIETDDLEINRIIREVVDEMIPLASEKGIVLRGEFTDTELPAKVDKKRIRQTLMNLLSNSIKFTFKGEIVVTARRENSSILIKVEDTGIGMDEEQMDNLFDPYYHQTRESDKVSGLGIGLSLCKIFVELHKGRIWAESVPGKGTIFSFSIPSGD